MDWVLAGLAVPLLSFGLAIADPALRHWFLLPVTLCGVLVAVDVAGWLRLRADIFDPQALVGLSGLHFFYLAPVLHVMLDYWAPNIAPPADWRQALGLLGLVNAVGLILYRLLLGSRRNDLARPPDGTPLDERSLHRVGLLAVAVGVSAFAVELVLFGGASGFVSVMTQGPAGFAGFDWLLVIAESFPLLAFVLVAARWRRTLAARPGLAVLLLVGLAVLQFLVGGLRGSRSNTIWPVLLGLILLHVLILRVSRKALLWCAVVFIVYMHVYGLYKSAGTEVVDVARGDRGVGELSAETGRGLESFLLGDLSRADIHAVLLDRQHRGDAERRYGISYLGDVSFLIPESILPNPPPSKVGVGTDALIGPGAADSGLRVSRVYGLTGEALLNFGPIGTVLSFGLYGVAVRFARRHHARARHYPRLAPKLLTPSLTLTTLLFLSSDLDNMIVFVMKQVLALTLVVTVAEILTTARRRFIRANRTGTGQPRHLKNRHEGASS